MRIKVQADNLIVHVSLAPQGKDRAVERFLRDLWQDRRGQDMVEYALAVGMLAVAAIATMPVLTTVVRNIFVLMNGVVHNNMP